MANPTSSFSPSPIIPEGRPPEQPPEAPKQGWGAWVSSWIPSWGKTAPQEPTHEEMWEAAYLTPEERESPPITQVEAAGKGFFTRAKDAVTGKAAELGQWAVSKVVKPVTVEEKQELMANARENMARLNDPQFMALAETLSGAVGKEVGSRIDQLGDGVMASVIRPRKELIKDYLQINIFRGLGNLARAVESHRGEITNYANQPALANIFIYLCKKGRSVLNEEALKNINIKYTFARLDYNSFLEKHPGLKAHQSVIDEYVKVHANSTFTGLMTGAVASEVSEYQSDFDKANAALEQILREENISEEEEQKLRLILSQFSAKRNEQKALFNETVRVLLGELFPDGLNDLVLPNSLFQIPGIRQYIYSNYVVGLISDQLFDQCEPLLQSRSLVGQFEAELKERTGAENTDLLVKAPGKALVAGAVNYLQTDPGAVGAVAELLESISPAGQLIVGGTEVSERGTLLGQISQHQQAASVIEAVQCLLNTQDPNIIALGSFFQTVLGQLATGLMAKGSQLVFPDGATIGQDQFLGELLSRMNAFIQNGRGNLPITEEFWSEFIKGLPVPPALKDLVVRQLVEKSVQMNALYHAGGAAAEATEQKIRGYAQGEKLLSIVDQVADLVVEGAIKENMGLVSELADDEEEAEEVEGETKENVSLTAKLGLDETIEELVEQFLPGIEITPTTRAWLADNIRALKKGAQAADRAQLIKSGVRIVLRHAIVTTIEKNFHDSGEYTAQLLSKFNSAFTAAFEDLSETEKGQVAEAVTLQNEIHENEAKIKDLRKAEKKLGTTHGMKIGEHSEKHIQDQIKAEKKAMAAETNVSTIRRNMERLIAQLNTSAEGEFRWDLSDVALIDDAIAYLRSHDRTLHPQALTEFRNIVQYRLRNSTDATFIRKYQIVLQLIDMDAEMLKVVSELSNTNTIFTTAQAEQHSRLQELNRARGFVNGLRMRSGVGPDSNLGKAIAWMDSFVAISKEIHQLSEDIAHKQSEIDSRINCFKTLSNELMGLLGLKNKNDLGLPAGLMDLIWPQIEKAKSETVARLIFSQLGPVMLPIYQIEANKAKIAAKSGFLASLGEAVGKEVISKIPVLVVSMKTFAEETLKITGVAEPTAADIAHMEQALNEIIATLEGGKEKLTEADFIRVYARFAELSGKFNLGEEAQALFVEGVKAAKIVKQIKEVVITPEEIAMQMQEKMPVTADIQALAVPELQHVFSGKDARFQPTLSVIQKYIEGMILSVLANIVDANTEGGSSVLVVATRKLAELSAVPAAYAGKKDEEIAALIIDQTLTEVIGLRDKGSIPGLPAPFDQALLDTIKKRAHAQLQPIILSLVQKEKNRAELDRKSGSSVLSNICTALSKDIVTMAPDAVKSYRSVAAKVFGILSGGTLPTGEQLDAFAVAIGNLKAEKEVGKKVTNRTLVEAFVAIAHPEHMSAAGTEALIAQLRGSKLKAEIQGIIMAPEEIGAKVQAVFANFGPEVQKALTEEFQEFMHNNPAALTQGGQFLSNIVEAILLKTMMTVAETNPPEPLLKNGQPVMKDGRPVMKDSLLVMLEKVLKLTVETYEAATKDEPIESIAQQVEAAMLTQILGFSSPKAFQGLSGGMQEAALSGITGIFSGMIRAVGTRLKDLKTSERNKAAEDAAWAEMAKEKPDLKTIGTHTLARLLTRDIGRLTVDLALTLMTEVSEEGDISGVAMVAKGLEGTLEGFGRGGSHTAKALLDIPYLVTLGNILGEQLMAIKSEQTAVAGKAVFQEALTEVIAPGLINAIDKVAEFEDRYGAPFDQGLMVGLLGAATEHFRIVNKAKERAKAKEQPDYTHQDLIEAAREEDKLHPATLVAPVAFDRSIDAIVNALDLEAFTNLCTRNAEGDIEVEEVETRGFIRREIRKLLREEKNKYVNITEQKVAERIAAATGLELDYVKTKLAVRDEEGFSIKERIVEEASALDKQRSSRAISPATKAVLKIAYPKGKESLREIMPSASDVELALAWKQMKENVPMIVGATMSVMLSPDVINTIVLKSLETTRDVLNEKIDLTPAPETDPNPVLDQVSGELIAEILKNVQLPGVVMSQLLNADGTVSPFLAQTMGGTLRGMLQGKFIQDKLRVALEQAVLRDKSGRAPMEYDTRPKAVKDAEAIENRKKMQKDLKKVSRQMVKSGISFYIRKTWAESQAAFDKEVAKLGPIGKGAKKGLDMAFRLLFITIIGNILGVVLWPLKKIIQEVIYKAISLDKNRDALLNIFTKIPEGQPYDDYVGFHENMIFNMGLAVVQAVNEAIERGPVAGAEPGPEGEVPASPLHPEEEVSPGRVDEDVDE